MAKLRVAVDIGGTFTDICILDESDNSLRIAKIPTSTDPIEATLEGLRKANVHFSDVVMFSHGTTVATNALIERKLPHTAMIVTAGFRDVIEIGKGTKEDLWDAYIDNNPAYIRRRDRLTVSERTSATGTVEQEVCLQDAADLAKKLAKRNYTAVAICFINSYANDANERWLKDYLSKALPGVAISTSSEVLPEIFEHNRFSTTVVNALLRPVVGDYAIRLQTELKAKGYEKDLLLLHSGGGVMTPKTIDHQAARLASSGIAAGGIANRYIGSICGFKNVIGVDMGGTSTDVSLTFDGEMTNTRDWHIEYGHPICFPSIDIKTVGAGGGSIAWIDEGGSLRNGPRSAGASPGPACYGQNGIEPTNTDANLLLGRLSADLVGGDLTLDISKAREVIKNKIAEPLSMDLITAAKSIISVANANMADAIRLVSIMKGYDPRDFALVAFGGAGALHGAALARDLSIPTVIIPPHPGVTSALGCLLVDIQHDLLTTYVTDARKTDAEVVESKFKELEEEAAVRLNSEGVSETDTVLKRTIDMRYTGQWRSLSVNVSSPFDQLGECIEGFEQAHLREYGYIRAGAGIEIFRLNLTAIGVTPKAEIPRQEVTSYKPEPKSRRLVIFEKEVDTPIYWRSDLSPGAEISGPAIIHQLDSTTVIPPTASAIVDSHSNIIISV